MEPLNVESISDGQSSSPSVHHCIGSGEVLLYYQTDGTIECLEMIPFIR